MYIVIMGDFKRGPEAQAPVEKWVVKYLKENLRVHKILVLLNQAFKTV